MGDKVSRRAKYVLSDGDDLHITESFQVPEDVSSVIGNSSIVSPIVTPQLSGSGNGKVNGRFRSNVGNPCPYPSSNHPSASSSFYENAYDDNIDINESNSSNKTKKIKNTKETSFVDSSHDSHPSINNFNFDKRMYNLSSPLSANASSDGGDTSTVASTSKNSDSMELLKSSRGSSGSGDAGNASSSSGPFSSIRRRPVRIGSGVTSSSSSSMHPTNGRTSVVHGRRRRAPLQTAWQRFHSLLVRHRQSIRNLRAEQMEQELQQSYREMAASPANKGVSPKTKMMMAMAATASSTSTSTMAGQGPRPTQLSPQNSIGSIRSTRVDAATGKNFLVRQKAQVVGRPSAAQSEWDIATMSSAGRSGAGAGDASPAVHNYQDEDDNKNHGDNEDGIGVDGKREYLAWDNRSASSSDFSAITMDTFRSKVSHASRAMYVHGGPGILGDSPSIVGGRSSGDDDDDDDTTQAEEATGANRPEPQIFFRDNRPVVPTIPQSNNHNYNYIPSVPVQQRKQRTTTSRTVPNSNNNHNNNILAAVSEEDEIFAGLESPSNSMNDDDGNDINNNNQNYHNYDYHQYDYDHDADGVDDDDDDKSASSNSTNKTSNLKLKGTNYNHDINNNDINKTTTTRTATATKNKMYLDDDDEIFAGLETPRTTSTAAAAQRVVTTMQRHNNQNNNISKDDDIWELFASVSNESPRADTGGAAPVAFSPFSSLQSPGVTTTTTTTTKSGTTRTTLTSIENTTTTEGAVIITTTTADATPVDVDVDADIAVNASSPAGNIDKDGVDTPNSTGQTTSSTISSNTRASTNRVRTFSDSDMVLAMQLERAESRELMDLMAMKQQQQQHFDSTRALSSSRNLMDVDSNDDDNNDDNDDIINNNNNNVEGGQQQAQQGKKIKKQGRNKKKGSSKNDLNSTNVAGVESSSGAAAVNSTGVKQQQPPPSNALNQSTPSKPRESWEQQPPSSSQATNPLTTLFAFTSGAGAAEEDYHMFVDDYLEDDYMDDAQYEAWLQQISREEEPSSAGTGTRHQEPQTPSTFMAPATPSFGKMNNNDYYGDFNDIDEDERIMWLTAAGAAPFGGNNSSVGIERVRTSSDSDVVFAEQLRRSIKFQGQGDAIVAVIDEPSVFMMNNNDNDSSNNNSGSGQKKQQQQENQAHLRSSSLVSTKEEIQVEENTIIVSVVTTTATPTAGEESQRQQQQDVELTKKITTHITEEEVLEAEFLAIVAGRGNDERHGSVDGGTRTRDRKFSDSISRIVVDNSETPDEFELRSTFLSRPRLNTEPDSMPSRSTGTRSTLTTMKTKSLLRSRSESDSSSSESNEQQRVWPVDKTKGKRRDQGHNAEQRESAKQSNNDHDDDDYDEFDELQKQRERPSLLNSRSSSTASSSMRSRFYSDSDVIPNINGGSGSGNDHQADGNTTTNINVWKEKVSLDWGLHDYQPQQQQQQQRRQEHAKKLTNDGKGNVHRDDDDDFFNFDIPHRTTRGSSSRHGDTDHDVSVNFFSRPPSLMQQNSEGSRSSRPRPSIGLYDSSSIPCPTRSDKPLAAEAAAAATAATTTTTTRRSLNPPMVFSNASSLSSPNAANAAKRIATNLRPSIGLDGLNSSMSSTNMMKPRGSDSISISSTEVGYGFSTGTGTGSKNAFDYYWNEQDEEVEGQQYRRQQPLRRQEQQQMQQLFDGSSTNDTINHHKNKKNTNTMPSSSLPSPSTSIGGEILWSLSSTSDNYDDIL